MASQGALSMVFLLLAAIVPTTIRAVDYVVGDDKGWTVGVDYQAWAKGNKTFRAGDRLIFRYPPGAHNVFQVDGSVFQNCMKPPLKYALTSGHDTIVLATPGRKWYICGVGEHCQSGQKLVINVQPQWLAPSPAPRPSDLPVFLAPWAAPAPWAPLVPRAAPAPWAPLVPRATPAPPAAQKRPFIRFFRG